MSRLAVVLVISLLCTNALATWPSSQCAVADDLVTQALLYDKESGDKNGEEEEEEEPDCD